jgi:hypothetical protein
MIAALHIFTPPVMAWALCAIFEKKKKQTPDHSLKKASEFC